MKTKPHLDTKPFISWIEAVKTLERGETPKTLDIPVKTKNIAEPYIFSSTDGTDYSYLVLNIVTGKEYFGRFIFCDAYKPFTLGFISIAKYFCDLWILISEYSQKINLIGNQTTSFFVEILSNRHINESWFRAHKSFYDWEKPTVNRLVVGISDSLEKASEFQSAKEQLEMAFPSGSCFVFQDSVCCLLSKQDSLCDNETLEKHLKKQFHGKSAEFGISGQFYDIRRLKKYYKQCLAAIQNTETKNSIVHFYSKKMFFNDFLAFYKMNIENEWLIHPKVQLLKNYDQKYKTDYVKCLCTFIENSFSIKNAAKELFIHYNTLDYRLQKIKEISFMDPKNLQDANEDIFQILLSCKLLIGKDE